MTGRQALGILLAALLVISGRWIRHRMLLGPDGRWRDDLWLEQTLPAPPQDETPAAEARPRLTAPLDINHCSVDSLVLLPRIGPVLAARIDAGRSEGLIFRNAGDLQRIRGIGPVLAARLDTLLVYAEADDDSAAVPRQSGR